MKNLPDRIQGEWEKRNPNFNRIPTLEEAKTRMIDARKNTSAGLFEESDVAARTCVEANRRDWGMSDDAILEEIGNSSDTSRTTMYARLLVGRVFPESWRLDNEWATEAKYWSHFEAAARTWSEERPDAPELWLKYCVDNNLSVSGLKAAIALAGDDDPGDAPPEYIAKNKWATVVASDTNALALVFDEALKSIVEAGDRVLVTVIKESNDKE
jgi:hypothetical protein